MTEQQSLRRSSRPNETEPYIMERYSGVQTNLGGDVFYVPAGGTETDGEMGIVRTTSCQAEDPQAPMHWHEDEHDIFLCLRGALQVWADGESRILHPGDLASIPAGTNHTYQPISPRTEIIGLIDTGGWEEFFFEAGEDYDGTPFTAEIDIDEERFGKLAHKYGINVAEQEFAEPDLEATDHELPGEHAPYFLESGYGPQYALGGTIATSLCTEAESDGSFGIVTYEGPRGTGLPAHKHSEAAKVIYIMEGEITGELDGVEYTAKEGEVINVPSDSSFSYTVADSYARLLTFTSGDSAHKLPEVVGEPWSDYYNPNPDSKIDREDLESASDEIDITVV